MKLRSRSSEVIFSKTSARLNAKTLQGKLNLIEKGIYSTGSSGIYSTSKDTIEPPDKNWTLYKEVYEKVPIVANAINNISNFAIHSGFELEGSEEDKRKVWEWISEHNADILMGDIIKHLLVFGNAFVELEGVKILPVEGMVVKGDKFGLVNGYEQVLEMGKSVSFTLGEIAHFRWNVLSNPFYGTSEIKSVLNTLTRILNYQEDIGQIIHRYGNPILHWKLGTPESPASQAQIDSYKTLLEGREVGEDLVTSSAVEGTPIISNLRMIQPDGILKQLENQLIAGLGVPDIFIRGGETSNKATGQVELQAFDRKVKAIRLVVSRLFEDVIFPTLVKGSVTISWNELSVQDEATKAEMLQKLSLAGVPLKVALKMVGWGSWVDDVEKEMPEEPAEMPDQSSDKPPKEDDFKTQAEWIKAYDKHKLYKQLRGDLK